MYGKLIAGNLYSAPRTIYTDEKTIINPPDEQIRKLGYKKVIQVSAPEKIEGQCLNYYWIETKDKIEQKWIFSNFPQDMYTFISNKYHECILTQLPNIRETIFFQNEARLNKIQKYKYNTEIENYCFLKIEELFPRKKIYEILDMYTEEELYKFLNMQFYYEERNKTIDGYTLSPYGSYATIEKDGQSFCIDSFLTVWSVLSAISREEKLIYQKSALYDMTLINLITIVEQFILDCIYCVLKVVPKALAEKASLDYTTILSCKNINELYEIMIDKKIDALSWQDVSAKLDFLKTKGLDFSNIEDNWYDKLKLLYEIRNILVHNNGITNQGMLKKLEKTIYADQYECGMDLSPNLEDVLEYIDFIRDSIKGIYKTLIHKFFEEK